MRLDAMPRLTCIRIGAIIAIARRRCDRASDRWPIYTATSLHQPRMIYLAARSSRISSLVIVDAVWSSDRPTKRRNDATTAFRYDVSMSRWIIPASGRKRNRFIENTDRSVLGTRSPETNTVSISVMRSPFRRGWRSRIR